VLNVNPGDAFKDSPILGTPHLHIVAILIPVAQEVLLVSVTSYADEKDSTCILDVGDHPFITHKSCISYRHAKVVPLGALEGYLNRGRLAVQPPVSQTVLERIIAGLSISKDVESGVKGWLRRYQQI
jgi:hypothetical protein